MRYLLSVCLAALAVLTACGGVQAPPHALTAPTLGALGAVSVPRVDISVTPIPLGLDEDGQLAVPPLDHPEQASWYALGPEPGEPGPSVVLAHVNAHGTPGAFARLHEVKVGDEVSVQRGNATLVFTVYDVVQADKDAFPADRVFADTPGPELRLITCGGALNRAEHSYDDNVIVFARA